MCNANTHNIIILDYRNPDKSSSLKYVILVRQCAYIPGS